MAYFLLICISLVTTGLAWKRILGKDEFWVIKFGYLILSAVPLAGPLFYLLIDPPESSPIAVPPEEFWTPKNPKVWPSFNPLINSLRRLFVDQQTRTCRK